MVGFAPPSKPVTLAPSTERCRIRSELLHITARYTVLFKKYYIFVMSTVLIVMSLALGYRLFITDDTATFLFAIILTVISVALIWRYLSGSLMSRIVCSIPGLTVAGLILALFLSQNGVSPFVELRHEASSIKLELVKRFSPSYVRALRPPSYGLLIALGESTKENSGGLNRYAPAWEKYKDQFHDMEELIFKRVTLTDQLNGDELGQWWSDRRSGTTPFFYATFAFLEDVDGDKLPDFIAGTIFRESACKYQNCVVAVGGSKKIMGSKGKAVHLFRKQDIIGGWAESSAFLWGKVQGKLDPVDDSLPIHNAKYGMGTGDLDHDGRSEIILNNWIILSSFHEDHTDLRAVSESTTSGGLLKAPDFPGIVARGDDVEVMGVVSSHAVGIFSVSPDFNSLSLRKKITLPEKFGRIIRTRSNPIRKLGDINQDGDDDFLIHTEVGVRFCLSKGGEFCGDQKFLALDNALAKVRPSTVRVGGLGDYDQDGMLDFWVGSQDAENSKEGRFYLVLGKDFFAGDTVFRSLLEIADLSLGGSLKFALPAQVHGDDGIGNSVSLFAGDFDADGLPDFAVSSHYNLDFAGAMYVLPGHHIKKSIGTNRTISVADCDVSKFRGPFLSQLAQRGDQLDNFDYNLDGVPDVVITADGDNYAGPMFGAMYFVDGSSIGKRLGTHCVSE